MKKSPLEQEFLGKPLPTQTALPLLSNKPHSYPPTEEKYSVNTPRLLSEIISIKKSKNDDIMRVTETIDLVFDRPTGNLSEITSIMQDDIDYGYLPQKFNIPIPEVIKWLNKKHILLYSRKSIGSLLLIDSKEVIDEYPDCISCILFEKVNMNDNFDIKVIVNLKYEDRYIKKSELLDVIFTNMNNFWVIIKKDNTVHLLYYYKTKQDVLHSKNSSVYSYSEFILENYTFICSMWTIYDITPDLIYILIYDQFKKVSIHQYVIKRNDSDIPNITLYDIDSNTLGTDTCGKFVDFCANYNISTFSIILELENNDKYFYTGMLTLNQIDNKRTQPKLEFTKTAFNKHISGKEAYIMLYNILLTTEENINLEEKKKHDSILKANKKYIAIKKLENDKKEFEKKEKESRANADKLLEEEEKEKQLTKKKMQNIKHKENIRIQKEKLEKEKQEKLKKERIAQLEVERIAQLEVERIAQLEVERIAQLEVERIAQLEVERIAQLNAKYSEELEDKFSGQFEVKSLKKKNRIRKKNKFSNKIAKTITKEAITKEAITKEAITKEAVTVEETINVEEAVTVEETINVEEAVTVEADTEEAVTEEAVTEEAVTEEVDITEEAVTVEEAVTEEVDITEEAIIVEEAIIEEADTEEEAITEEAVAITEEAVAITEEAISYISNKIEFTYTSQSLYFMFMYNMSMINPEVTNALQLSQSKNEYNELLLINRFYVMYALDMLVINSSYIRDIKIIMDKNKDTNYPITALYGSYLPIIYSLILNEIGFDFNAFGNNINPLDKLKDYDTLKLKLLHDYNETHIDNEFIKGKNILIGYTSNDKPITVTNIQSSSIQNLLCKCWDLNYTSAILLFEDNTEPYINRNPDFTEFLFGQQPIQIISGKNESSLYDYNSTMYRLNKALTTWY